MRRILKVYRATRFSPNSVDRDRAIIDAVGSLFECSGYTVDGIDEESLTGYDDAEAIISMARTPSAIAVLSGAESKGITVLNTPDSVTACRRSHIDKLMRAHGIPAAPLQGENGYWIKRGDAAAQSSGDVVFAANADGRDRAIEQMRRRGISDIVVTAHVTGCLVKFYGVSGTNFFRTFRYVKGDYSKFGLESRHAQTCDYNFNAESLMSDASRLATLIGIDAYGGDCIIRPDGSYAIIDFNDWPSFAICRDEAAKAIASRIRNKLWEANSTKYCHHQ